MASSGGMRLTNVCHRVSINTALFDVFKYSIAIGVRLFFNKLLLKICKMVANFPLGPLIQAFSVAYFLFYRILKTPRSKNA